MKLLHFISLLVSRPSEAFGRLEGVFDSRMERFWMKPPLYRSASMEAVLDQFSTVLQQDLHQYLAEEALQEIESEVFQSIRNVPKHVPFGLFENADLTLARICYVLARTLAPRKLVETGVCSGVTTAFLLQALEVNGSGELHSIDLPPLGKNAADSVGWLIPRRLQRNWRLYRGTSKSELPRLLRRLSQVDLFVHDSLHTYRNMRRELAMVAKHLGPNAAVLCDDIGGNRAFSEWAETTSSAHVGIVQQHSKDSLLGAALVGLICHETTVSKEGSVAQSSMLTMNQK
jgi:hypothetical protein